ncbi:uncharacterized protein At4g00950-like isoform X1 [Ananas comosus]|uniref:Uncharacterized protein At4g00950-like isoform X1 n=1 Tax=Ananas comosus TaxID=4615 RepID=A0A6P5GKT4_ANACO|nr:uncharacterized protein At4g00950-like isoform X1 [Ananas comosus]XP_020106643.1 uncharacterized protein At4g00950-like isoform X2 [Ananas comosus]XP_020106644.1 uncharacterized protein At4g00950-like isoform X1 [Ananas comosus]
MASRNSADPSSCYSTPPKLCFYSLPSLRPEPPGLATPPLHLPASVPFLWEEAPGRPKRDRDDPPPLVDDLIDARRTPHPYPWKKNSSSSSSSSSSRIRSQLELPPGMAALHGALAAAETKGEEYSPTAVLDGPYALNEHAPPEEFEERKARITRFGSTRKRSLANVLSLRTTSHLWTNIYESLKQVVSRRRARKTQVF